MGDRPKSAGHDKNLKVSSLGHYVDLADLTIIETESHYTELPDPDHGISISVGSQAPLNYSHPGYMMLEEPVALSDCKATDCNPSHDISPSACVDPDGKVLSTSCPYSDYDQIEVEDLNQLETRNQKVDGNSLHGVMTDGSGDMPYASYAVEANEGGYDAYAIEDLPEAPLNKNSYLVEETPAPVPEELNFGTAFTGILISDPMRQLELPPTPYDDEEVEEDFDVFRNSNLLRRSSSSSQLRSSTSSKQSYRTCMDSAGISPFSHTSSHPVIPGSSSGEKSLFDSQKNDLSTDEAGKNSQNFIEDDSHLRMQQAYIPSNSSSYSNYSDHSHVSSNSLYSADAEPNEQESVASNVSLGRRSMVSSGGSMSQRNFPSSSLLTTPQAIQETLDSKGSWNERFQMIYDSPDSEAKYDALHRLSLDFLGVAETYGKVIISELSIPDSEKSIKPINIGGVAGGSKYAVHGLLFKFAVDVPPHFLYGSDEYAQKAAGHELKGLDQWSLNSEGLHFPLMALVRYCGFTLVVLSMLPIGHGSLVYGSDDAGKTVHFDDDVIYEKMKNTATNLKLKGHHLVADTTKLMYGPGDIEGHYGTDHLHYVLDFARVYPPAALVQGEVKENYAAYSAC